MEKVIELSKMVRSPAQMRTTYDVGKLAELTLQMYIRGWDGDRPALVRFPGDAGGGQAEIVRGHRRRMAYLMALELKTRHPWDAQEEPPITLDDVAAAWEGLIAGAGGNAEAAAELLAQRHGDVTIAVHVFEGNAQQATLFLQNDNYGDEEPDDLGVAYSLHFGVQQGLTLNQMAQNMGLKPDRVRDLFTLSQIDPDIAQRIASRELGMSIAPSLVSLNGAKRTAASQLLREMDGRLLNVKKFEKVVRQLREWNGLEMPVLYRSQAVKNIARSIVALWNRMIEEDAARAWFAAVSLMYAERFEMPWDSKLALNIWLDTLGVGQPGAAWGERLPLVAVTCPTCPISQLPAERLAVDLGAPTLPCRAGIQVQGCFHGLTPDDPFTVTVPAAWNGHPGIVREGDAYLAKSYDDLLAAWTAQQAAEQTQPAEEEEPDAPDEPMPPPPPQQKKGKEKTAAPQSKKKEGPTPVQKQRAEIRLFMTTHAAYASTHILGTPCVLCQHQLDHSPSKSDKHAPNCAWADRPRTVAFSGIRLINGLIPVCHQFAPAGTWREIVPAHPNPPAAIQRDWLIAEIKSLLTGQLNQSDNLRYMQFLTGRPMGDESYGDWFSKRLDENAGDLSDAQLYTLFVLALGERERFKGSGDMWIPADNSFMQMVPAKKVSYPQGEK